MTRRYNLSHPAGQPMPEDWIHLPDSVVAAADYDAVSARLAEAETNAEWAQHWKDKHDTVEAEIERLRAGLQLIAGDKNRLMNEVARQTAASILGGKPIGEVPEWPTREEAEKRAAELMAIGRATLAAADSAPDVTCATHGCTYRDGKCIRCWGRDAHSKAIDSLLDDCATVYGGPFPEGTK